MKRRDFSEIEKTLRKNGVGFINVFFRSNLIFSRTGIENYENTLKKVIFDFSDGKNYLGTFNLSIGDLSFHSKDNHDYYSESVSEIIATDSIENQMKVRFYFSEITSHMTFSVGECSIVWYSEEV